MKVNYNFDLLKAINDLTIINDRLAISKGTDTIDIKCADEGHLIMYHLSSPLSNLDISEDIAFYDYSRFFNKFGMFDDPELDLDCGILTCKSGTRVATHNLASTSVIVSAFNKINIPSVDVKFSLTAEMIKNFKDLSSSSYFDSNRLTFSFGDTPYYKCHSTKHANTFKDDMNVERITDEEFDLTMDSKVLTMIPSANYDVQVSSAGIMELEMKRTDDISVTLYIAKVKE